MPLPGTSLSSEPTKAVGSLTALALDVQFRYREGQFLVCKVTPPQAQMEVSPELLSLFGVFNGHASTSFVDTNYAMTEETKDLQDLNALINCFHLAAEPFVDYDAVSTLIETSHDHRTRKIDGDGKRGR